MGHAREWFFYSLVMPLGKIHAVAQTAYDLMMPSKSTNVFVSYSHADASLVAPVVKLLRANKSLVFQDIDDIQPGKRWQSEIAKALVESHLVVVFWCDHASRSHEVSKEWKAAIEQDKDLLPLLLDTTPLPPELAEYQWIDFRGVVGANHSSIDSPDNEVEGNAPSPRSAAPAKSGPWLFLTGLALAVLGIVVFMSLLTVKDRPTPLPGSTSEPPSVLLLLGVLFAVCLVWLLRRRARHVKSIERARLHPGEMQRRIAGDLEAEILRRTALRQDGGA